MTAANKISLFLALRYLKPKRTFVSVITVISILGVTLGVAVLILVMSVMAGFEQEIKNSVLGFEPHIEVGDNSGFMAIPEDQAAPQPSDWFTALEVATEVEGVSDVFPYVDGLVFLDAGENPAAVGVRSVRQEDQGKVQKLTGMIDEGAFDLSDVDLPDDCDGRIVVGRQTADRMRIGPGSIITAYAPNNVGEIVRAIKEAEDKPEDERGDLMDEVESLVLPYQLQVAGVFGGNFHYDQIALMPLHIGQEIFETRGAVTGLGILTDDAYRAGEVKERLLEVLPLGWFPQTWMEKHETWFATIRSERDMMLFVLFMIVLVAAFCTMNTMITVTVQKRREIGIITALGARVSQVMWIFLGQGMVVGIFGALTGVGTGLLVVALRNQIRSFVSNVFRREIFSEEIYGISAIPAKVLWSDVALIAGGAFLLCAIASLIPAYMAARTDPAKALRND